MDLQQKNAKPQPNVVTGNKGPNGRGATVIKGDTKSTAKKDHPQKKIG
jgi:hypothetical protein